LLLKTADARAKLETPASPTAAREATMDEENSSPGSTPENPNASAAPQGTDATRDTKGTD